AGQRRIVQPIAARKRDRQLHQDRPAHSRTHPRRGRARPDRSAAGRHVGRRDSGRARRAEEGTVASGDEVSGAPQAAVGSAAMPPLTARSLIGFFAMASGMFMAILDIQIVSASLSQIQAGLSASAEEISWVQTSYLIAEVV